jgi:asparagine synthase (glutamine-hydrolysing)
MCGIAGIYHWRRQDAVEESSLTRMRDTMIHRGPDGAGNWISPDRKIGLAHRRLSIVDLSASASQPMTNEDGAVWITFNGEIYNHLALRRELLCAGHEFRTDHSDTEVLIHGYEQWGIGGLLRRIEGDYAFGLWDGGRRVLFLARDRIGVKPLYFSIEDGRLLFASEIKAILSNAGVERDIEPIALYHYLSFLTTPAPLTMFKGVFKLPAGCYLTVGEQREPVSARYWDAVPGQGIPRAETEGLSDGALERYYLDGIRSRLEAAVEKRMMSDVPFGVFLSGGIDSSTNVALMSRLMDRPVETFTVGFKDYDHLNELEYASQVAREFKTNHHEILIGEKDMVGYLDDLIHHQDEPIADWVCIPLYFVSRLTKDSGVTVIQVGEGSDEQFSGYGTYMAYLRLYEKYWSPFRRFLPGVAQRAFAGAAGLSARVWPALAVYADIIDRAARGREVFWSGAVAFFDLLKRRVANEGAYAASAMAAGAVHSGLMPASYLQADTFNVIQSFFGPFDQAHPGRDVLTRMIYSEFRFRLPELLLMRVDKITMSTSLEARVPFLDHDLVEFTMDIPQSWKIREGEPKYLLKKAIKGLIPDEIIRRKKMGFGAPMREWLRGEFGKQAESSILGSPLLKRGFFNNEFVASLIRDHRQEKRDNSLYVWALFNLTAWYDYWIGKAAA